MKIKLITLGCPKNLVDSEFLTAGLKTSGAAFVSQDESADAVIINTCGFIDSAKEESIETILSAIEWKKQGRHRKVFVTGCLSARYSDDLQREIPEIDGIYGNQQLEKIVQDIAARLDLRRELLGERELLTPRHYAYLKISEGCEHPCSFCAIPAIRGKFKSQPIPALVAEAQRLAARSVRELILIAQDTTYYGVDLDGQKRLAELLTALSRVDGIEWLRLMYAYPNHVTDELIEVIASSDRVCKYIDMPVQHISSRILKRMARKMDQENLLKLIEKLRQNIPGLVLRTSVIVGFPGETEQDFQELYDYVAEGHFDRLGVFTFSSEEGTPAAHYPGQISEDLKRARQDLLVQAQEAVLEEKNAQLVGKEVRVLIDAFDPDEGVYYGRTEWDCPDIDQNVVVRQPCQVGAFYRVKLSQATPHGHDGQIIRKETKQHGGHVVTPLPVLSAEGV